MFLINPFLIALGQMALGFGASQKLKEGRPSLTSPAEGLGISTDRPLSVGVGADTPGAQRATGGARLEGTPEGVATQLLRDREAGFNRAREAEMEARGATEQFRTDLGAGFDRLQGLGSGIGQGLGVARQQFGQAQQTIQQTALSIDQTVGEVIDVMRNFTGDVVRFAQDAQQNLGDFVVSKMEAMRTGINQQFDTIERQAMDALANQPGGASSEERAALKRGLALQKAQTIASSFRPVLAEETTRLINANLALGDMLARTSGTAAELGAAAAGSAVAGQTAIAQIADSLATHRAAAEESFAVARANLGQFAETMLLNGNRQMFDMVLQTPRPFLVASDISNFLMEQYFGLVEAENIVGQAEFGNLQATIAPLVGGGVRGFDTLSSFGQQQIQASAAEAASQNELIGGVAQGAGNLGGGIAQAAALGA